MQRISYKKTNDPSIKVSKHLINKNGVAYYVKLNIDTVSYEILHVKTRKTVRKAGANINNMNVLKRNIKKDLIELGIPLKTEIRDRTFGICKKGYTQNEHDKD